MQELLQKLLAAIFSTIMRVNATRAILKNYIEQNKNKKILKIGIKIKIALLLYLRNTNMLGNVHRMHLTSHA